MNMDRLPILSRLPLVALLLGLGLAGWVRAAWLPAPPPISWSSAHAWHLDSNGDQGYAWVANEPGAKAGIWQADGHSRLLLADALSVTPRRPTETYLTTFDLHHSTIDTSDQSDASARIEARAGPTVSQQSRAVLPTSQAALRSRTRTGSTPRAPPTALRLA